MVLEGKFDEGQPARCDVADVSSSTDRPRDVKRGQVKQK